MRTIKFRAWNEEKMSEPFMLISIIDNGIILQDEDIYDLENCELMQYTGLKDKNGKEIYEGDKIKWTTTLNNTCKTEHVDTMTWVDHFACYMLMPFVHEPHGAEMEVIGNIYEVKI